MKLFIASGSPNCRKVLATIDLLGIEVDVRPLDFAAGELRTDAFLAVNPNALVPVLEDGELHLWESNAIMQYLTSRKPGSTIFPDDAATRADISRWQFWEAAHFGHAAARIVFEQVIKPAFMNDRPDNAAVEAATRDFHRFAPVLERQLDRRDFIIGRDITLADLSVAAHLTYAAPARIPLEPYSRVRGWLARMDALPAWARSLPSLDR